MDPAGTRPAPRGPRTHPLGAVTDDEQVQLVVACDGVDGVLDPLLVGQRPDDGDHRRVGREPQAVASGPPVVVVGDRDSARAATPLGTTRMRSGGTPWRVIIVSAAPAQRATTI